MLAVNYTKVSNGELMYTYSPMVLSPCGNVFVGDFVIF